MLKNFRNIIGNIIGDITIGDIIVSSTTSTIGKAINYFKQSDNLRALKQLEASERNRLQGCQLLRKVILTSNNKSEIEEAKEFYYKFCAVNDVNTNFMLTSLKNDD